jgi:hypothetical protein
MVGDGGDFVAVFRLLTETKPITSRFLVGTTPILTRDLKFLSSQNFLFCPSRTLIHLKKKLLSR